MAGELYRAWKANHANRNSTMTPLHWSNAGLSQWHASSWRFNEFRAASRVIRSLRAIELMRRDRRKRTFRHGPAGVNRQSRFGAAALGAITEATMVAAVAWYIRQHFCIHLRRKLVSAT